MLEGDDGANTESEAEAAATEGDFWDKGAYNLLYYVNGKRYRERIGPNLRQAEAVLGKRRAEIREGHFFEKRQIVTTTFDELALDHFERVWFVSIESQIDFAVIGRIKIVFDLDRYFVLNATRDGFRGIEIRYLDSVRRVRGFAGVYERQG